MSLEKINYWKDLVKAAFMDAATMPFNLPQNVYERKKAAGVTEETARDMKDAAKLAINMATIIGTAYGILGIVSGLEATEALTEAIAIPYAMLLSAAGATTHVVNGDSEKTNAEKKTFQSIFWPNVTAAMENHSAEKPPAGPRA